MKQKIIIIIVAIVSIIVLGFIWYSKDHVYYTTYFKGYYSEVAGTEEHIYESVIETNGLPEETWEEERTKDVLLKYLKYSDGRLFVFQVLPNGNYSYRRVEITNPAYVFGRKKIGVGTEMEAIEQAYKNSYVSLTQDKLHEESYYVEDGKCAVDFYFDEEGKVEKIMISEPDIYHRYSGWKNSKQNNANNR